MSLPTQNRTSSTRRYLPIIILVVLVLIVLLVVFARKRDGGSTSKEASSNNPAANSTSSASVIDRLEVPAPGRGQIIQREGYTLSYNEDAEQADWVAYILTNEELLAANVPRTNRFLKDPKVTTGSADNADYEGSSYDRGHLAPAEDMSYSVNTMKESFYYSNMSPQVPAFNRGVWKRLEELVRFWASAYDSLYIVTGPVLTPGLPTIGHNKVAVPQYYYKVALQYSQQGVKGIGFILPNEPSAASLKTFAVSIDEVERRTGIDFFPKLPDTEEQRIEGNLQPDRWRWTRKQ